MGYEHESSLGGIGFYFYQNVRLCCCSFNLWVVYDECGRILFEIELQNLTSSNFSGKFGIIFQLHLCQLLLISKYNGMELVGTGHLFVHLSLVCLQFHFVNLFFMSKYNGIGYGEIITIVK